MAGKITEAMILKIAPRANRHILKQMVPAANHLLPKYGITKPKRIALFLANIATETGGFRALEENLNYSAKRLTQVWKKRFPTIASARPYAHNPEKLANKVYGGRGGNKGHRGWGWKYRGRGFMQTTFSRNYMNVQKVTGLAVMDKPELLTDVYNGLEAACIYWNQTGCNFLADEGKIKVIRKRINGGYHGLKEVSLYYRKAIQQTKGLDLTGVQKKILTGTGTGAVVAPTATDVATNATDAVTAVPFYENPGVWVALAVVVAIGTIALVLWKKRNAKEVKEGIEDANAAVVEAKGMEDISLEYNMGSGYSNNMDFA
jgi:putative chitinase